MALASSKFIFILLLELVFCRATFESKYTFCSPAEPIKRRVSFSISRFYTVMRWMDPSARGSSGRHIVYKARAACTQSAPYPGAGAPYAHPRRHAGEIRSKADRKRPRRRQAITPRSCRASWQRACRGRTRPIPCRWQPPSAAWAWPSRRPLRSSRIP